MKKWETKKPTKFTDDIVVNNEHTKYPVIPIVCATLGWKTCDGANSHKKSDWDIYWTDYGLGIERIVRRAHSYQRINHIPGMINIYRKNNLARALSRMQKLFGDVYDFFPKTWILPHEYNAVKEFLTSRQDRCVIIKPAGSAQGKGIYLALTPNMIQRSNEEMIAQEYVMKPLTIDGKKFDMRVYCLVTSVEPLRILVYNEGLVRLCTASYNVPDTSNVYDSFMHLTNYAVNKYNANFVQSNDTLHSEDVSNKRSLSWLWKWMNDQGMNHVPVWRGICDIIVKTLLSTQSYLSRAYGACKMSAQDKNPFTCFEILGFDILLTDTLVPILLEVNHTPSFRMDSKLDERIKTGLVMDTMRLLNVNIGERNRYYIHKAAISQVRLYGSTFDEMGDETRRMGPREISAEHYWKKYKENEGQHLGNFALIYPTEDYPNQPTRGMQKVYDYILSAANAMISVSGGVYSFFNAEDMMPMPSTTTPSLTPSPTITPSTSTPTTSTPPPAGGASLSEYDLYRNNYNYYFNNKNSTNNNSNSNSSKNNSSNSHSTNNNSGSRSNSYDMEDVTQTVSEEVVALSPVIRQSNQSPGSQDQQQQQEQGQEQGQEQSRGGGYSGRHGAVSFSSPVPSLATAPAVNNTLASSASEKITTSITMMMQQQQLQQQQLQQQQQQQQRQLQQQQPLTPQPPGQGLGQGASPRRIVTHENPYMSQSYRSSGSSSSHAQPSGLPSAFAVPTSSEKYHRQHQQQQQHLNMINDNNKARSSLPLPLAMNGILGGLGQGPGLGQGAEHELGQKIGLLGGLGPLVSAACGIAATWGWAPGQGLGQSREERDFSGHGPKLIPQGSHIHPSLTDRPSQPSPRPCTDDDKSRTNGIIAATPVVATARIQRLEQATLTTPPRYPQSNHSPLPTPTSYPPYLNGETNVTSTNVHRSIDNSMTDNLISTDIINGSINAAMKAMACVPPKQSKASRTANKPSPSPIRVPNPLQS